MLSKRIIQKLEEKHARIDATVNLKVPDRVPVTPWTDIFYPAAQSRSLTYADTLYKGLKASKTWFKVFKQYDFDQHPAFFINMNGPLNDMAQYQHAKWPGAKDPAHKVGENSPFQYIETEWMNADDYKYFNTDITGYLLRNIVPKQNPGLAGFAQLPLGNMLSLFGSQLLGMFLALEKDVRKMKKRFSLPKLMMAMFGTLVGMKQYSSKMKKIGNIVAYSPGIGICPFDILSDSIRGMKGTMLDMRRHPEELKTACEILLDHQIRSLGTLDAMFGEKDDFSVPMSFIPLHRGADGFMSSAQFEEFYWPTLTRLMEAMIEKGYRPMPFFEGHYDQRLEYLADFAKKHPGKMVYWFHRVDMKRAKEMMGDYVTIRGNVPESLMIGGTPQQMEDYVKQLCEDCMEGGGFLLDGGCSGIVNEARHENIVAMVKATQKYGVYRK
jgi:hypothetical protein